MAPKAERSVLPERVGSLEPVGMEVNLKVTEHVPGGLRTSSRGLMRTKQLTIAAQAVHNRKGFTRPAGPVSEHVQQVLTQSIDLRLRTPNRARAALRHRDPHVRAPHLLRARRMRS